MRKEMPLLRALRRSDSFSRAHVFGRKRSPWSALAFAVAAALAGCGASTRRSERLRRVRIQRLIARGSAEVQRSPAIVAAFSFDANKLGGSLFVEQP